MWPLSVTMTSSPISKLYLATLTCIALCCLTILISMPWEGFAQAGLNRFSSWNLVLPGPVIGGEKPQSLRFHVTTGQQLAEISEIVKVPGINCTALFNGLAKNKSEMATKAKGNTDRPITDLEYASLAEDCHTFQTSRGYIMSPLTQEEEDFPLAYSLLVYKEAEMVERLLRAIYRPQNYYCIHVDNKSSVDFFEAMLAIVRCFPNVFLANKRINVEWGLYSVLEPELICMKDMWKYPRWKYFINLTGQEFALKTNYELVKIFKAYRGANDVETRLKCAYAHRWKNTMPPYGIRPIKGGVHVTVSRAFVDYVLHNRTARDLLNWTINTIIPDETFFPTLNANPQLGIKGSYTGSKDTCIDKPYLARYKMWDSMPCATSRRVRQVCILTTGDLPRLTQATHLFANKFFLNEDRTVIGCLEEKIFNDTRDEYLGLKEFNTTLYSQLDFVKNQVV